MISEDTRMKMRVAQRKRFDKPEEIMKLVINHADVSGSNNPNYRGEKVITHCDYCGKIIERQPSGITNHIFCNNECSSEWRKINFIGDKNPHWKGGITPESQTFYSSIEWDVLRKAVYKRDNWTCQECGNTHCMVHAHHVVPLSEDWDLRLNIDNCITLCVHCHGD